MVLGEEGHTAVIGMQWGDEGKGKIVDVLARDHKYVARYGGGANAGHTVIMDDGREMVLHLIPCGVMYDDKVNVLGNVFTDLDALAAEADKLGKVGRLLTPDNFLIAERGHLTTPYHWLWDLGDEIEKERSTGKPVGTTLKGIGPTAGAKVLRAGIRMADLVESSPELLEERLAALHMDVQRRLFSMDIWPHTIQEAMSRDENRKKMTEPLRQYFHPTYYIDADKVLESLLKHRERFARHVTDVPSALYKAHRDGQRILFEGAQGTFLDIDWGGYPYVTSTSSTVGGIFAGTSYFIPIETRLGILKAYATRVGSGSFPTELLDEAGNPNEIGRRLQERGGEFGATTGRKRRTGRLDLVMAERAVQINGINRIAVTKLDVLDEEEWIDVALSYKMDGSVAGKFPATEAEFARVTPVYAKRQGWRTSTSDASNYGALHADAREYLEFVSAFLNVPVTMVSNGAKRGQLIQKAA